MRESLRPIGLLVAMFVFGAVTGGALVYAKWQGERASEVQSWGGGSSDDSGDASPFERAPHIGPAGASKHHGRHGHMPWMMGPPVEVRVAKLTRRLNLTDEQKKKATEILDRHYKEREKLAQEMMAKVEQPMHEARQKMDADIRAILTQEQQKKFDELLKHRRKWQMPEPDRPPPPPAGN